MLRAIITVIAVLVSTGVCAQNELTISDLAKNSASKAEFSSMVKGRALPAWVTQGGVSSPAREVRLAGALFQVLTSCKPHDCASERVALLWSPQANRMMGVFSRVDDKAACETLTWLNIGDSESIDGKTVLYAALAGSLENHPDAFNSP